MSWETTSQEACTIHVLTGVKAPCYTHAAHGPPGVGSEVAVVFRFSYEAVKALANDDYCAADIPVDDEGLPATWSWVAMVCPPAKLLNIYSPEEGRTPPRREATGWAFSSHAAKSAAERAVRRMWGDCLPDAPIGSFSRSLPGSKT